MEESACIGSRKRKTEIIMSKTFHFPHDFSLTFHSYNSLYNNELPNKVKRVKRFSYLFRDANHTKEGLNILHPIQKKDKNYFSHISLSHLTFYGVVK